MRRRLLIGVPITALVALVMGVGLVAGLGHRYDDNIERFESPFIGIPEKQRPARPNHGGMTILLLGSDSRISAGEPALWKQGAQRTDTIMLVQIPANRQFVRVVSIPRDSWVAIPGHGHNKVNAAYSYGGPPLLIRTIEKLTEVRIDHVVIADFTSFADVNDAVGGVTLDGRHMDGLQALAYVRERKGLPRGDLDRVQRQQAWLRAVVSELVSQDVATSPIKLHKTITALTGALAVDDGFSASTMRKLAFSLRHVDAGEVHFDTAPVAGTGRSPDGTQAIIKLDRDAGAAYWSRLRRGELR